MVRSLTLCFIVIIIIVSGNCNEGAVRLVNGTLEKEGRLEVCSNGVWGTFCGGTYYSNTFSKSAAHVSCQQLGYNDHAGIYVCIRHLCLFMYRSYNL